MRSRPVCIDPEGDAIPQTGKLLRAYRVVVRPASLSMRDLRAVLDVVRSMHDSETIAEFRATVPDLVRSAVGGDLASYHEVDLTTGKAFTTCTTGNVFSEEMLAAFAELSLEHPTLRHVETTGDGSAVAISDLVPRDQFLHSPLYLRVLGQLGAQDQIVIGLPAPRPLIIGVPLNRDSWGFSGRDRQVMNELRPHLAQGHAAAISREVASRALACRDSALEAAGNGVVQLRVNQVVDASAVARRCLDRVLLRRGELSVELRAWLDAERTRLDGHDLPELARPFYAATEEGWATIRFVDSDTLLVEEFKGDGGAEDLQRLGLTQSQAAVLHQIVLGATTAQAAHTLHVTVETVRKHLQAGYRKLGVHSRVGAVAIAHNARSKLYHTVGAGPP